MASPLQGNLTGETMVMNAKENTATVTGGALPAQLHVQTYSSWVDITSQHMKVTFAKKVVATATPAADHVAQPNHTSSFSKDIYQLEMNTNVVVIIKDKGKQILYTLKADRCHTKGPLLECYGHITVLQGHNTLTSPYVIFNTLNQEVKFQKNPLAKTSPQTRPTAFIHHIKAPLHNKNSITK